MSEITEEQKEVIWELRRRLGGRCGNVCPKLDIDTYAWMCEDCIEHFLWLANKKDSAICPCYCIPYETIDLRFSELLEEEI